MIDDTSEIIRLLREILKWTRFSGIREVRTVMMSILDTEQKRLIYHLSDGECGSVEIGEIADASDSTIRRYWEAWARLGIMETLRVKGGLRYTKSFELADFGFGIPHEENMPKQDKEKEGET